MLKKAVFLDRDGTINEDSGYLSKPEQFIFLPQALEALAILRDCGFLLVLITNQSGIARGYFTVEDLELVHGHMCGLLQEKEIELAGIYYCPHHPQKGLSEYVQQCNCRKPGSALLQQAADELKIDLSSSYMIGDKASDLGAGWQAGCESILVLTGEGKKTFLQKDKWEKQPLYIAENLYQAALWLQESMGKEEKHG